ncbi:MAG: RNA polymerase sigma-70 factor [Bacteroidia bacterium]
MFHQSLYRRGIVFLILHRFSQPMTISTTSIISGDNNAFEQLFHQWYARLCRYAMRYLTDTDEARDLVQGVFVKLWENRAQLAPTSPLGAFLYTAVRNACLNHLNHQRVRQDYHTHQQGLKPEWSGSPQEVLEAFELEERIREAIAALPERCREAFVLSREEGLSYQEIAQRMGISPKTVEGQISKALKLLRQKLGPLFLLLWWPF